MVATWRWGDLHKVRIVHYDLAGLPLSGLFLEKLCDMAGGGGRGLVWIGCHGTATHLHAFGRAVSRQRVEMWIDKVARMNQATITTMWQCCHGTVTSHEEHDGRLVEINPSVSERRAKKEWLIACLQRLRQIQYEEGERSWSSTERKSVSIHWYFAPIGFVLRRRKQSGEVELDGTNFLFLVLGLRYYDGPKNRVLRKAFGLVQQRWNGCSGSYKVTM